MDASFLVSTRIDDHRSISITTAHQALHDAAAAPVEDAYLICEDDDRLPASGRCIIAKVGTLDSAYRLVALLKSVVRQPSPEIAIAE